MKVDASGSPGADGQTPNPHVPARSISSVIFWDFDGTVYRAPSAYRRYAEEISLGLPPARRPAYLERFERYLQGEGGIEAADAWDAAMRAAGRDGDPARHQEAFRRAREYLDSEECAIEVPAGLRETVERIRPRSRLVLLSNTPAFGVFGLLGRLGVADLFDEVVCEAGKPGSLPARLAAARAVFGLPADALLSVGDISRTTSNRLCMRAPPRRI
jgi:FMN phosphatase YigB (HAD superfamily)